MLTHFYIGIFEARIGSKGKFFGSYWLEAQYLWPGLDPGRKKWARARPGPEKTGSIQPYHKYEKHQ